MEIEIGVLADQCLDRRIESMEQLTAETAVWEKQRNATGARISWADDCDGERQKLKTTRANVSSSRGTNEGIQPQSLFVSHEQGGAQIA